MEKSDGRQSANQTSSDDGRGIGWSGDELDDVPLGRVRRFVSSIAMSDEQLCKAGVLCALIIVGFAAFGVALSRVAPEAHRVAFSSCANVVGSAARLSCYDRAAVSAGAPFKGGSPFSTYLRADVAKSS